ncbi:GntR family transcriptional regulator [Sodalis ligni]|uniref:GntR family transcriptional regulator n=1 Tax=Sodalis ligni TaxID=2697027 RepID=A0A4V2Q316_9GAMM|nr:GntR family transcriptional regulator [Sodalis ligni]TCL05008.1 GntR family transcriptional regulator [Sodalis ligni]
MLSHLEKTDSLSSLLDPSSPIPLFHQLRDILERWFCQDFTLRDDLPTEKEITERFGVSRITVRRAIDTLINESILTRPKSRGRLRLQKVHLTQKLNRLRGFFTDDLLAAGIKASTKVIDLSRVKMEKVNDILGLQKDDECYRVERLHYGDGKPVAHQVSYIPVKLLPDLEQYDLSASLMQMFDKLLKKPVVRGEQQLVVQEITMDEATYLDLPINAYVIKISRTAYTEDNQAIEYFIATLNPKCYQFSMSVYAE